MLVVAALGRSALAANDAVGLEAGVRAIAEGLAPIARAHRLVVVHASGRATATVGVQAHLLGRELQNVLPGMSVASLMGHCVVANGKGNGNGEGMPHAPCRLVEIALLRRLLQDADTLPCVGAIPVRLDASGEMVAAAPAFDGDAAAAAIATELGADVLLLLGDADAVYRDWPARGAPVSRLDAAGPGPLPTGVARKVGAACDFARTRGTFAVIGRADSAASLLAGHAGTCVAHVD